MNIHLLFDSSFNLCPAPTIHVVLSYSCLPYHHFFIIVIIVIVVSIKNTNPGLFPANFFPCINLPNIHTRIIFSFLLLVASLLPRAPSTSHLPTQCSHPTRPLAAPPSGGTNGAEASQHSNQSIPNRRLPSGALLRSADQTKVGEQCFMEIV